MSPELDEVLRASNSLRSSVKAAEGFVSGQRIRALRYDTIRLERALWAAKDQLEALIRAQNT